MIPIFGLMLKEKALKIAQSLGMEEFAVGTAG